jgi:hypothetical protein
VITVYSLKEICLILIESGVWRGFVSKLIRKISPDVHIISLDPVCRVEDTSSSNHEIMIDQKYCN